MASLGNLIPKQDFPLQPIFDATGVEVDPWDVRSLVRTAIELQAWPELIEYAQKLIVAARRSTEADGYQSQERTNIGLEILVRVYLEHNQADQAAAL